MRCRLLTVLCLVLSLPAFGDGARKMYDGTEFLEGSTATFSEVMSKAPADSAVVAKPGRPSTNVVLEGAEDGFIFAAAGSAGAFRTEAVIANRQNRSQRVLFFYFPQGGSNNCNRPSIAATIPAQSFLFFTDFVQQVFGDSGTFGAVAVLGVTSTDQRDPNAAIDGNARIYAPAVGGGTASQLFPAFSLQNPAGFQSAFGLRSDEAFRTNWGIFNYDTRTRRFDIFFGGNRANTITQITRDVPACSLVQERVPGGPYGFLEVGFLPQDNGASYYAYGSTVDNVSTDSYSVPARQ